MNLYRRFVKDCLTLGMKGKSSLASALSATPTLYAAVVKGYVFDESHSTYADLTGVSAVVQALDPTDSEQVSFTNGVLWLKDGGPASALVADEADGTAIVLWVDHGSWTRLIGYYDSFDGQPFSIVTGDQPVFRWPRYGFGLMEIVQQFGANWLNFFPHYWGEIIGGMIGGSGKTTIGNTVTMKCDLLGAHARYVCEMKHKADVHSSWWAMDTPTPKTLANVVVADGVGYVNLGADDIVWSAIQGVAAYGLVFWNDTGNDATSDLIWIQAVLYLFYAHAVPLNGINDLTLQSSVNKFFTFDIPTAAS